MAEITIKQVEPAEVAYINYRGPFPEAGQHFEAMYPLTSAVQNGPAFCLHHAMHGPDDAEVDCCVPVSAPVTDGDLRMKTVPGGRMVVLTHRGGYEKLGEVWEAFMKHIQAEGLKVGGPSREIYVEWNPTDPAQYVTELMFPLIEENGS